MNRVRVLATVISTRIAMGSLSSKVNRSWHKVLSAFVCKSSTLEDLCMNEEGNMIRERTWTKLDTHR